MDIHEIGALLHIHDALAKYGDAFPSLKKHVWNTLKEVEAEHVMPNEEPTAAEHPGLTGNVDLPSVEDQPTEAEDEAREEEDGDDVTE
jgi:hypothetical protein